MGEADTITSVWRTALAIIGRYPLAVLAPAAVLGALGEVPAYLIDGRPLLDQALTLVTAYVAYYLYLVYAEGIVRKAQQGAQRLGLREVLDDLIESAPLVPSVLVAALISLSVTTIATGLLLIPGVWLYTRWSLTTPVIREEGLGPLAATRRSNELVRGGRFWLVFMTATVAYYLEGVVIHEGALVAGAFTGSHTWGSWRAVLSWRRLRCPWPPSPPRWPTPASRGVRKSRLQAPGLRLRVTGRPDRPIRGFLPGRSRADSPSATLSPPRPPYLSGPPLRTRASCRDRVWPPARTGFTRLFRTSECSPCLG